MPMDPVRPTMTMDLAIFCPPRRGDSTGETRTSGNQDGLAGRLAAFEVDMRLCCFGQRIALVDGDLHLAALDHLEQRLGRGFEVGARRGVGAETGAREIER